MTDLKQYSKRLREAERKIAVMQSQYAEVTELKQDVKESKLMISDIKSTLDNLSGGKRALIWLTGTAIAVAGIVIAWMNTKQ